MTGVRIQRQGHLRLPADADYAANSALSKEARRVLGQRRPATLGEAALLAGVDPADVLPGIVPTLAQRLRRTPR